MKKEKIKFLLYLMKMHYMKVKCVILSIHLFYLSQEKRKKMEIK